MNRRIDQLVQLILAKSEHCKHGCCCSEYIIIQTFQTFKFAYLVKTGISLFQFLLKLQKNKFGGILRKVFLSKDNMRFCLFLTLYTACIKGIIKLYNHRITLFIEKHSKGRQTNISILLRTIWRDDINVLLKFEKQKILGTLHVGQSTRYKISYTLEYAYVIIYSIMQLFASYAYFFEEDSFGEKQTRLWERFQNLTLREQQYRALTNLSVDAR